MDNTEKLNEEIAEYLERNCSNCYAKILADGRIWFSDKFEISDLIKVMEILGYKLTKGEPTHTFEVIGENSVFKMSELISHADVWSAITTYVLAHRSDIELDINDFGTLKPVSDFFNRSCNEKEYDHQWSGEYFGESIL